MERAVNLARGGLLHFDLPSTDPGQASLSPDPSPAIIPGTRSDREFLNELEMIQREREYSWSPSRKPYAK